MPPKAATTRQTTGPESGKGAKGPSGQSKPVTVSNGSRSEMENCFDRLRALDKSDNVDIMGLQGIHQLCTELGIAADSFEMMVLMWKLGAIRKGCITRWEWLTSLYTNEVDQFHQLRTFLGEWVTEVSKKGSSFAEMYYFLYDFIRGENDRLMAPRTAVQAWDVLLKDEKMLPSWNKWVVTEYKRSISRDLWRQLWVLFSSVKSLSDFDPNGRWPTAIDDFVEWHQRQPTKAS